jgi:hypothetical protein
VSARQSHVVQVFDGVAAVSMGDALLTVWSSGARAARIRWVADLATELIARSDQGIVAAQFLLPSATPPGLGEVGTVRAALPGVLRSARRLVVVPMGDSVWQSVVRTVMRAGLTILGQSALISVAPSAPAALELLACASSRSTPDEVALRAALDSIFAALGARLSP